MAHKLTMWTGTRWVRRTVTSSGKVIYERELKNLTPPNNGRESEDKELKEIFDRVMQAPASSFDGGSQGEEDLPQKVADSLLNDVLQEIKGW